jgi:hypothetical protein
MLRPESEPGLLQAPRFDVPRLEARQVRKLPLLCMWMSVVRTSHLRFVLVEQEALHGHLDVTLNLFLFPSIREYRERNFQS